ncbi:MAG TPA: reverse transcriptase domain-containing protein, partial [Candidatus Saccharimonadales bacterium]
EVEISESIRKILISQGDDEYEKFLQNNGLPQGSILSPMFSNVYLSNFDQEVSEEGLIVIRYVDDLIVVTKTKEQAQKAYRLLVEKLSALGLKIHELNSGKTSIQPMSDVTFLGIRFKDGNFYPSQAAYAKMLDKLSKYPKYKTFIKNIQSLKMLSQAWASTYYFCSSDEEAYKPINEALGYAVDRTLNKARLVTKVKFGARELRRLGIYQFDNAIVRYRQHHKSE